MFRIIETELCKLKRYHIVWAGVFLMLLSILLTLFTSTADNGEIWTFSILVEQVIKNNTTMIFPMCITLIAGYIIMREERDDTLKSIVTIPISYRSLLCGKLAACAVISVFFGVCCAVFTVVAECIVGFGGFEIAMIPQVFFEITVNCFFLYIAVLPVIVISAQIAGGHMLGVVFAFAYGYGGMFVGNNMTLTNIYPIMASLGMIDYRSYDEAVHWNMPLCALSLCAMLALSMAVVMLTKVRETKKVKKRESAVRKKGW
ncbi:MAG: ABC transporter permease [Eubacterium sp.]|nr:ABC transporter permease [Eubacterium sp.]